MDQFGFRFEDCALGLSARRIWEHTRLRQLNPFAAITPTSAPRPSNYVDIVDVSGLFTTLTGLTLSDLLTGKSQELSQACVSNLLQHLNDAPVRQWLAKLEHLLWEFSGQRALRNVPTLFLPTNVADPLRVRGIHCALATWLHAHRHEKATVAQWFNRINNLTRKGLRADEMKCSGISEKLTVAFDDLGEETRSTVKGDELFRYLNYEHLRFSILPMILPVEDDRLTFLRVPSGATVKRIKPKLKKGPSLYPQWYDRVLGYWVDKVVWDDLLGHQNGWMAFTHRGQPVVANGSSAGLCATPEEAWHLANIDAKRVFPKITAKGRWSDFRLTGGKQYREWLVTLPYYPQSYFSDHFSHRNVLLHVRCDTREGADGDRVLVLHEVQSDWAQEARRALIAGDDSSPPIPLPPWLKEWPTLALKLMLLHAVRQGAAALAWTQGDVQVERYAGLGETGLLELYDHTLPTELERILRPYGRKCECVEVFQPVNFSIEPTDIGYEVRDEGHHFLGATTTWDEAQKLLPDGAHEILRPMNGVRLDAELRRAILKHGFFAWGTGIQ